MAKRTIDVWIGNIAFGLGAVIVISGLILTLGFGDVLMFEYNNPVTGAIAALCIILLYVFLLVNAICSVRGMGWWWWSLTKALVSFIILFGLTPEVVKILGTSIERFEGTLNRSFYLAKDCFYGITFLVLLLPITGVILKLRRRMKKKEPVSS